MLLMSGMILLAYVRRSEDASMFAPKVAKSQTEAAASSTNKLKQPASRWAGKKPGGEAVAPKNMTALEAPRSLSWSIGNIPIHPPGSPQAGRVNQGRAALQTAKRGISGSGDTLPYRDTIQHAFGAHDAGDIRVHTDAPAQDACRTLGAHAYAYGPSIALAKLSLFTVAHEAAHVVQQRERAQPGVEAGPVVGEASDAFERHADAVAEAVVAGRPAHHLLDASPGGAAAPRLQLQDGNPPAANDPEAAAEAKKKADTSSDIDAILAAGRRERAPQAPAGPKATNAASIVYRILRLYYPDLTTRWWISGVGGSDIVKGVKLTLTGTKNVDITVGRDFIAQTDEAHLQDRVDDVGRAFASLEADHSKGTATAETTNTPSLDEAKAIEEGGKLFAAKAEFGLTAGNQAGPDDGDGYDARYWKEEHRNIVATVEPWLAMSEMVKHLGDPIPMKDGRMTHWHFDCFEGMDVVRKYAEWRTSTRTAFNQKNSPLSIGFNAYLRAGARDLDKPIKSDRPGGAPYSEGEMVATTKGGKMSFETTHIPAGPSMDKVLEDAPAGSWVCFTNLDISAKLLQHSRNKEAGKPIAAAQQAFIDRISPWNNENALKISHDRYSAFPFGVVDAATIMAEMAKIVFDPAPVPAGYIQRNIYISSVVNKKP
jgi:hypothetical protein